MIAIVGATSSIGQALARQLAQEGNNLVLAARNEEKLRPIITDIKIRHNVEVVGSVIDVMDGAYEAFIKKLAKHKIQGVVLVQGYMDEDDGLALGEEGLAQLVRVNYESVVGMSLAYVRSMQGFLCVVNSVAAERGKGRNLVYTSSKGAVSIFLFGLEQLVKNPIIEIRPGFVDTPLTYGMRTPLMASRERVAKDIRKAIRKRKRLCYTPWFWRWIMTGIRWTPRIVWNRLRL